MNPAPEKPPAPPHLVEMADEAGSMIPRMLTQTTLWLVFMAALLFLGAGTLAWPQGWAYLAETAFFSLLLGFWLARADPALLASRLSMPTLRLGPQLWDRAFVALFFSAFLAWLPLMAIDAGRTHWSAPVPLPLQLLGAALIAVCMALVWRIFRVNTFASPQIHIQTERNHHVIAEGPYAFIRHPMYAAALLYFAGVPLLLGSWWALAMLPLGALAFALRALGEEALLRKELPGYTSYTKRVRYRFFPGVW